MWHILKDCSAIFSTKYYKFLENQISNVQIVNNLTKPWIFLGKSI
jgi:hypothetical protein